MRRRRRRGVSLGTIVMLTLSVAVLAGFLLLTPRFIGRGSFESNAAQLAVALDKTIVGFSSGVSSAVSSAVRQETNRPLAQTWSAATPTPSATPAPTVAPKLAFTLCATGSLKWSGAIQKSVQTEEGYAFEEVLSPLAEKLSADVTIGMLENSLLAEEKKGDANADPALAAALFQSGFRALSLGCNNALNYGVAGLKTTQEALYAAGVLPFGAYATQEQRSSLTLTSAGGVKVALLGYQSGISSTGKKKASAEEREYAVAQLQLPMMQEEIRAVREAGAQVVIVSLSWGKESAQSPTDVQRELAQGLADAGADVILGYHPEAVQEVVMLTADRGDGQYHPTLCAYGLGNLLTSNREKRSSLAGVILRATVQYDTGTGRLAFDGLSYTPTYCWRGKDKSGYHYRVYPSNLSEYPEEVAQDQRGVMSKCLDLIRKQMEGSVFQEK